MKKWATVRVKKGRVTTFKARTRHNTRQVFLLDHFCQYKPFNPFKTNHSGACGLSLTHLLKVVQGTGKFPTN